MAVQYPAAYGIITGGLGLPADKGMITNFFQLGPFSGGIIPPRPPINGGGGGTPMAPGVFYDKYKFDPDRDFNLDVVHREFIVLTLTLDGEEISKEYTVNTKVGHAFIRTLSVTSKVVEAIKHKTAALMEHEYISAAIDPIIESEITMVAIKSISTRTNTFIRSNAKAVISKLKSINNSED